MIMKRGRSGFTLVEVVLVVVVMSLVTVMGIPALNHYRNQMRLNVAADEIVTAIRYVQSLSMKEGLSYGVKFDSTLNRFTSYKKSTGATIQNPYDKRPYAIDFDTQGHLKGVVIDSAVFGAGTDYVEFDPEGETGSLAADPATAGDVVLRCSGSLKTVSVSAPLGRASVQ